MTVYIYSKVTYSVDPLCSERLSCFRYHLTLNIFATVAQIHMRFLALLFQMKARMDSFGKICMEASLQNK